MTDRTTTHDPTSSRPSDTRAQSVRSDAGAGDYGQYSSESERERARHAAEEIKSAAKDAASSTATALRNRLSGELDYRKYRSRQRLNRFADALRQTGTQCQHEDEVISRYMERAAQRVESAAAYLDQRDVNQIMRDAQQMARRRPEVFVGGLFVAGLVVGRFLRSSAPEESYDSTWDDYPSYAGSHSSGAWDPSSTNPYAGTPSPNAGTNPYSGSGSGPTGGSSGSSASASSNPAGSSYSGSGGKPSSSPPGGGRMP